MAEPYLGQIILFAGNFAPSGWALCQGQILSIAQNQALFAILGTTYGGDGQSTFALPDLRSRVPVGYGQGTGLSNYSLGEVTGTENVTLLQTQMPQHTHQHNVSNAAGSLADPTGAFPAEVNVSAGKSSQIASGYAPSSTGTMAASAIATAGGSQPHSNIQPVLCLNYIIALQGIFPSRS